MERATARIMDRAFNLKAEIDNYESLMFTKRLAMYGEFEMHIAAALLPEEVSCGDILFLDTRRAGFIEYIELSADATQETATIRGFSLEHLLTYRVTEPAAGKEMWAMEAAGEDIIKALLAFNLGSAAASNRRIPELTLAPSSNRGDRLTFETWYTELDKECEFICSQTGLGLEARLDFTAKKIIFDTIAGRDMTTGQSTLPPVIFSMEYDNVYEQQYIHSTIDYKNTGIIGGDGDGTAQEIAVVGGENAGLDRREIFINARSSSEGASIPLATRGAEMLTEYNEVSSLTGKINPFHSVRYGRDFYLHDKVTMKYGRYVLHAVVTEATEIWDESGYSLEIQFGSKVPTIIDKIKRRL